VEEERGNRDLCDLHQTNKILQQRNHKNESSLKKEKDGKKGESENAVILGSGHANLRSGPYHTQYRMPQHLPSRPPRHGLNRCNDQLRYSSSLPRDFLSVQPLLFNNLCCSTLCFGLCTLCCFPLKRAPPVPYAVFWCCYSLETSMQGWLRWLSIVFIPRQVAIATVQLVLM